MLEIPAVGSDMIGVFLTYSSGVFSFEKMPKGTNDKKDIMKNGAKDWISFLWDPIGSFDSRYESLLMAHNL